MIDTLTVFRKECLEAFGNRHSLRGAMFQTIMVVAITGITVPALEPAILLSVGPLLMLYVIFPSTLAATLAADAFAGERERRTIETVMATPLSEVAMFVGKAATAVLFAVVVAGIALTCAILTAGMTGLSVGIIPAGAIASVLAGALAGSVLTAAVAIGISIKIPVARSAQQIASVVTFIVGGLTVWSFARFDIPLTWTTVLETDLVLLLLGIAGLIISMMLFRRGRLFDER